MLTIRKGDNVKLAAFAGEVAPAIVSITDGVSQPTTFELSNSSTSELESLTHTFDTAGEFTVSASATQQQSTMNKQLTVKVVDFSFAQDTVAAMVSETRSLDLGSVAEGVSFEADETFHTTVEKVEDNTKLSFEPTKTNKRHAVVARAYPGGPVLDVLNVDTFWLQAAADNYFWVVERHEDYETWENTAVVKNLPDNAFIKIRVIVNGPTLDDLSLERVVSKSDFDAIGEYAFRLFHPNDLNLSTCHMLQAYDGHPDQAGTLLGEALYGGKLLGDVEE